MEIVKGLLTNLYSVDYKDAGQVAGQDTNNVTKQSLSWDQVGTKLGLSRESRDREMTQEESCFAVTTETWNDGFTEIRIYESTEKRLRKVKSEGSLEQCPKILEVERWI